MSNPLSHEEIANRFGFHKATIEGAEATMPVHADLRKSFENFANYINEQLTPSREASLALTHLEDAAMWAHKAVARTAPLEANPEVPHVPTVKGLHQAFREVGLGGALPETTTPEEFAADLTPKESPVVFESRHDLAAIHRDFHQTLVDPECPFCKLIIAGEPAIDGFGGTLPKTASNG